MNELPFQRLMKISEVLKDRGITHDLSPVAPTSKASQRLDAETEQSIGRISAWESDEWDLEVLDIESEVTTHSMHLACPSDVELQSAFDVWVAHML